MNIKTRLQRLESVMRPNSDSSKCIEPALRDAACVCFDETGDLSLKTAEIEAVLATLCTVHGKRSLPNRTMYTAAWLPGDIWARNSDCSPINFRALEATFGTKHLQGENNNRSESREAFKKSKAQSAQNEAIGSARTAASSATSTALHFPPVTSSRSAFDVPGGAR